MDLDQPDVVAVADAAEGRDEVPRLDRAELQFTADALQLLTDVNDPGVEVDVFPAEAEHLAAAQAVENRMTCTLRTESPASSRWLRNIWTAETDSRARLLAPQAVQAQRAK